MSYTAEIKDKLAYSSFDCEFCALAKLAGLMRFSADFEEGRAVISTESEAVLLGATELLKNTLGIDAKFSFHTKSQLYKTEMTEREQEKISAELMSEEMSESLIPFDCCKKAFLEGAFLGGGSVSEPNKKYHMEFDTKTKAYAEDLQKLLAEQQISAKISERRSRYSVYIKDIESIAAVLGLIGQGAAALEFYNVSVEKELRNEANRIANCDIANLEKQGRAASKQLAAIKKIEKTIGLDSVSDVLKEMAIARKEYPDDTIGELGARLNPPIGKSGVNHRLKRLIEIAENIK
ncbi:MAG: DNA-binding protein WhiA [Clostridia bacterium]|nr:DNA-binding protein WhiA [Clostridia bacterium]